MLQGWFLLVVALLSVVVAVLALQEFLRLQAISAPDLSAGAHVRKFFFALLGAEAFYRAVALVVETLAMPGSTDRNIAAISVFVRCSPHLLYLSAYSILVLYWAQLCYTLDNTPFFHTRTIFLGANFAVYVVTLITFILICFNVINNKVFFCEMALVFSAILCAMVVFFVRLIKLLPDQLISVKNVHARLHPLTLTCCSALFLGAAYYWCVAFNVVNTYFGDVSYSTDQAIYMFDAVCVLVIETIPSFVMIYFLARIDSADRSASAGSGSGPRAPGTKQQRMAALGPRTSFSSPYGTGGRGSISRPPPRGGRDEGGLRFEQPHDYESLDTYEY